MSDFETLKKWVSYDPVSGKLYWLARPSNPSWSAKYAGKEAFTATQEGYRVGAISNKKVYAHRVAWALHHGREPIGEIDHVNGNRSDNRIKNLREVSRCQNARNMKRYKTNSSGHAGVQWRAQKRRWVVRAYVDGAPRQLGSFKSKAEAIAAAQQIYASIGYHENHGRVSHG